MSLLSRVASIFKPQSKPETTASLPRGNESLSNLFSSQRNRENVVSVCRQMYAEDPRIRGVINTVARDAVKGGFNVKVNDERAQMVSDALLRRLRLASRLDDWVRLTLRDGDSFLELGVSGDFEIVSVTRKPTLLMRRNSNSNDLFDDPTKAYWMANNTWETEPSASSVWFADWQIIHARWNHDEGSRYGEPLFACAVKTYKRIQEGETDISIRRKTRAGMIRLHVVEGATEEELDEYRRRNKDQLDNAFSAVADFFTNKPGALQVLQGDANLAQIEDVMHHIRTLFLASPIPMSLLGYGQDLNRDVLEKQEEQYRRALEQITQWVEDEFVAPLLERQWLLAGLYPDHLDYEIEWQSKWPLSSHDALNIANAALTLRTLGVNDELIVTLLQRFLPGIDVRAALQVQGNSLTPPNETGAEELALEAEA